MKLWLVCCVCGAVLAKGDAAAPISHGYCRLCAAAQLRQLLIWDSWEED